MDIKTLLRLQGVKSMELSKALHFLYKLKYFWTCLGMENIIEILSAEKAPKKRNTESLCGAGVAVYFESPFLDETGYI